MRIARFGLLLAVVLACVARPAAAQAVVPREVLAPDSARTLPISPESFRHVPETYPADGIAAEGVRALFIAGPDWKGKPTRIFAWYGRPPEATNAKVPAMVLIHGGGGTAFDRWVRFWNGRGYAAIAIDTCGCVPLGTYGNWRRHEHGGPPGWDAGFSQLDQPVTEQWPYHAVVAVGLAHSLIRSFPEVDAGRIGVTGISWGGYLTCIVAGVDRRFRFAVPVYGCGFLADDSAWLPTFEKLGPEKTRAWTALWDPSVYLPHAMMPFLWINGTNDFAYPMDSWRKSYRLPRSDRSLCLRIRMPHGHERASENPPEIQAFSDAVLKAGKPLPRITGQSLADGVLTVTVESPVVVTKAELCYTQGEGRWQDREWLSLAAEIDAGAGRATARVPDAATVLYMNCFDERGCVVSSEHIELSRTP